MLDNFSFVWNDQLAGAAKPGLYGDLESDLQQLRLKGITALVNLTADSFPIALLKEFSLDYLNLPIPNFAAPYIEQVQEFIEFVDERVDKGEKVLVFCLAGYGRTGTMLACYLARRGFTPDKAIGLVRQYRPGSIETPQQESIIFEYYARMNKE